MILNIIDREKEKLAWHGSSKAALTLKAAAI